MTVRPHVLDRVGPDPDEVLSYADGPAGLIDVYRAVGHDRGVVVLIHGGFWRNRYDRGHLRPLAGALAAAGWTVALPEFRRIGDPGGGWPGTLDDVVEVVQSSARLLGTGLPVLVGHSSGGHLAILAAARASARRVVSLAGVLDLAAARRDDLSAGAVSEFLTEADAAADPVQAPLPSCPIVLIHGDLDDQVPVSYSRAYVRRSPRIEMHELPGVDHYDVIDPESSAFATLLAALDPDRSE